jgi:hypothetical protein
MMLHTGQSTAKSNAETQRAVEKSRLDIGSVKTRSAQGGVCNSYPLEVREGVFKA